jgi:hypothetical protein
MWAVALFLASELLGFLSTLASVGHLSALVATVGLLSALAAMGLRVL